MRNFLLTLTALICLGAASLSYSKVEDVVINFDTYESGDLNGQDGWSDLWNSLVVEEIITPHDGEGKALKSHSGFGGIGFKSMPAEFYEHGGVRALLRVHNSDFSDDQSILSIFKKNTQEFVASVRFTNAFNTLGNTVLASESSVPTPEILGSIDQDSWHVITLEWREADHVVRARVDEQPWTEWFPAQAGWSVEDDFGVMVSLPQIAGYGNFYLDDVEVYVPGQESLPEEEKIIIEKVVDTVADVVSSIIDTIFNNDTPTPETETPGTASSTPDTSSVVPEVSTSTDPVSSTVDAVTEEVAPEPTPESAQPEAVVAPLAPEEATTTTTDF